MVQDCTCGCKEKQTRDSIIIQELEALGIKPDAAREFLANGAKLNSCSLGFGALIGGGFACMGLLMLIGSGDPIIGVAFLLFGGAAFAAYMEGDAKASKISAILRGEKKKPWEEPGREYLKPPDVD